MTVPNILTVVGTGGALVVAGSLMLGTCQALGLSAALPAVPIWASFLLFGVVFLAFGVALVDRGGGDAAEKVQEVEEELSVTGVAKNFPLIALAEAPLAGFALAKLLSGGGRRDVQVLVEPATATNGSNSNVAEPRVIKKPTVFDSIVEQMIPLAALAVSTAAGVGMKTLGIPEPADLIAELLGMASRLPLKRNDPPTPSLTTEGHSIFRSL